MLSQNLKSASSRNCQALEQLQKKDLITHKVLKLLKRSGSQCKYTAEYRFKIAKQPSLNKATSAATHFRGKYTSIQIRESAATEAVIGGILWKKLFLNFFSIFTGKHLCQSLFLINLQAWRPATLFKKASAQVFSCEYWEILKNTYFEEYLWTVAPAFR